MANPPPPHGDDVRALVTRLRIQPEGIPFGAPDLGRAADLLDAAVALAEALQAKADDGVPYMDVGAVHKGGCPATRIWKRDKDRGCECGAEAMDAAYEAAMSAWRAAGGVSP